MTDTGAAPRLDISKGLTEPYEAALPRVRAIERL
jgi:hypothetical protein